MKKNIGKIVVLTLVSLVVLFFIMLNQRISVSDANIFNKHYYELSLFNTKLKSNEFTGENIYFPYIYISVIHDNYVKTINIKKSDIKSSDIVSLLKVIDDINLDKKITYKEMIFYKGFYDKTLGLK